jgi:hypothetical protein
MARTYAVELGNGSVDVKSNEDDAYAVAVGNAVATERPTAVHVLDGTKAVAILTVTVKTKYLR